MARYSDDVIDVMKVGLNLLEQVYVEPEPETEAVKETVKVEDVALGDQVDAGTITEKKVGTKWVYLTVQGPTSSHKGEFLRGTEVKVLREKETKESQKARDRARRNRALQQWILGRRGPLDRALEKFNANMAAYDHADPESVLVAQADHKILARFAHAAEGNFTGAKDLVELRDAFVAELVEYLVSDLRHRALSRSTSVISNLLEDVEREATARFIEQHRRGW